MEIKNTDILQKFRKELPQAVGYNLSNEQITHIAENAVGQFLDVRKELSLNGNTEWLNAPCIQSSLLLLTYCLGDKRRKCAPELSVMTHLIADAHLSCNHPIFKNGAYDKYLVALIGLHHDTGEMASEEKLNIGVVNSLMLSCCTGDTDHKDMINYNVSMLTDSENLHGSLRLDQQIKRAANGMNEIGRIVRFYDKMTNLLLDVYAVKKQMIPSSAGILKAANMNLKKKVVVDSLLQPITQKDKDKYTYIVQSLFDKADDVRRNELRDAQREITGGSPLGEIGHYCKSSFSAVRKSAKRVAAGFNYII